MLRASILLSAVLVVPLARADDTAACDARMAALSTRLTALAPYANDALFGDHALVTVAHARPYDGPGWLVIVHSDGTAELDYSRTSRHVLAEQIKTYTPDELAHRKSWPTYLAPEPATSVASLRKAIAEVKAAGLPAPTRVIVRLPPPPAERSDATLFAVKSVAELRDAIGNDPGKRLTLEAHAMRAAIAPCAPIVRVLGFKVTPSEVAKAADAARSCSCKIADLDVFEYVLLEILHAFDARYAWIDLPALPAKGKLTVAELLGAAK